MYGLHTESHVTAWGNLTTIQTYLDGNKIIVEIRGSYGCLLCDLSGSDYRYDGGFMRWIEQLRKKYGVRLVHFKLRSPHEAGKLRANGDIPGQCGVFPCVEGVTFSPKRD